MNDLITQAHRVRQMSQIKNGKTGVLALSVKSWYHIQKTPGLSPLFLFSISFQDL